MSNRTDKNGPQQGPTMAFPSLRDEENSSVMGVQFQLPVEQAVSRQITNDFLDSSSTVTGTKRNKEDSVV